MKTPAQYDVAVLGGGTAGKSLAIDLGNRRIKTALIERSPTMIGGSCINVACTRTKTLITSSCVVRVARRATEFGIHLGNLSVDWGEVRSRMERVVGATRETAKTMSETRGRIQAVINSKTERILGCAILSVNRGEMMGTVQMTMIAALPYSVLCDAVLSHPTMVEGFNNLFANL